MANINIGSPDKLLISIPSKGDTNWNDVVKAAFEKICNHDHSGINGQGKKIKLQDLDQVNPTGLPEQGDTLIWDDTNQYFDFQTAASAGGSGGGSGVNHIAESTADTTVSTWATKTNANVNQAENAEYLILTVNVQDNQNINTNILRGDRSFQLEKTANVSFEYYASVPFSVPKADRARLHTISFSYFTGSTFLDNSVKVKIYDTDNNQYISVIGEDIKQAQSAKKHYAQCQLSTSTNFELRLVVNNSDTQAWKMYFDDVSVSPKVPVFVDGTTVDTISEYLLDKDVYAEADVDTTQTYSSLAGTVNLGTQTADTTGSLSLVTNEYTVPMTGIYDISFIAQIDSTAGSTATVTLVKKVSGSATPMLTRELIVGSNNKVPIDLSLSKQFTANDKLFFQVGCTATATLESGGFVSISKKQSPQTLSESSEVVAFHITNQADSTETTLPNPTNQSDATERKQVNVLPPANKISTIVDTHSAVDESNRVVKIARSGLYKITTKVAIKDYDQNLKKIQIRKFSAADVADPTKGNGNVANVASSNAVNAISTSLDFEQLVAVDSEIAIGTVIPYGGGDVPEGYHICHGATLANSSFKRLKSALNNQFDQSSRWDDDGDTKTTYSAPGSSSFRLPDLRNSYMRGVSNVNQRGDNLDDSTSTAGLGVSSTTTITDPGHSHGVTYPNYVIGKTNNLGDADDERSWVDDGVNQQQFIVAIQDAMTGISASTSTSLSGANETRPNTTKMNFLIKSMNFKIMEATFFAQLDAGDYIFVNARSDASGSSTARLDLSTAFNFELKGERLK